MMRPWQVCMVFISLFLIAPMIGAQELGIYGYGKWFAHPNLNDPYPFDRLGFRTQLNFTGQVGERVGLFSALDFNFEETQQRRTPEESRSAGMEVYPVEAYIDLYFSRMDLRIGKQFIFWGKTDWINPTDNINPWDYKNISAEIEDYRIPVSSAKASFYLGAWTLEGVLVFEFLPHRIPMHFEEIRIPGATVEVLPVRMPKPGLKNVEFGLRASSAWKGIDFSASLFRGFAKTPSVVFKYLPLTGTLQIQPIYGRITVLGADFVTTRGKFAFKGEGAYFFTEDRDGTDPFVENPYLYYAAGMDYYAADDLTLNLQFVQKIRFKYSPAEERTQLARRGLHGFAVAEKRVESISCRIQYEPFDFTSLQLIGVVNLKDRDYFLLPILNYQIADGVNIYGGATLFRGPEGSPFGRNKPYSRAFVEIKYSFSF